MKISRIDTHIVNIPLEATYYWAPGFLPGATKTIVEVFTDDGLVGLGEVHGAGAAKIIDEDLCPRLVGEDPLNRSRLRSLAMPPLLSASNFGPVGLLANAYGAIDIALHDLAGKAVGQPLHQLLGGAYRDKIAFSEYFTARLPGHAGVGGERTAVEVAAYCARMVEEHDSPIFEGKIGYDPPRADIKLVHEIRAAIGPERALRLDPNMGWDLQTARWAVSRLEQYDIANIEDPVSNIHDMARLRQHTTIAFSSHVPDLRLAAGLGVPDTFVVNLTTLGGIGPTIAFINACNVMGHNFWFYSGDAGIATACYLQISAAIKEITYAHQSLLRWQTDDVIVGGTFLPEAGFVKVPVGPGLGVEIDREALNRCKSRFDEQGSIDAFGTDANGRFRQLPLRAVLLGSLDSLDVAKQIRVTEMSEESPRTSALKDIAP